MSEPQQLDAAIDAADLVAMRRALRALVEASPLSTATIEAMAGLPRNYLPKILAESPTRGLSSSAIYSLLPIVGHKIALVPDPDAARKIRKRHDYQICDERQRRKGGSHWKHAKALALASKWGQEGAKKLLQMLTKEEISRQRSKAAKARWRAWRRAQRASRGSGTSRAASLPGPAPVRARPQSSGSGARKAQKAAPSPAMPA